MEQEQTDIDDFFKQRLEGYKKEPRPLAWEKIQEQIGTPKARPTSTYKMIAIYLAAASVCLLLGITYLFSKRTVSTSDKIAANRPQKDTVAYAVPLPKQEQKEVETTEKQQPKSKNLIASAPKTQALAWTKVPTSDKKAVVHLPDSSVMYVKAHTTLSYRSDFLSHREVLLTEGEAYFEVKKQNGLGFIVKSNLAKTEVLGTSFIVRSYQEEGKDEIYVISGKVAVSSLKSPEKKVVLLPKEKGWVDKNDFVSYEKIVDENYAAWKEERIVFQNTDLGEVAKTLQEYYGVTMHISNPELLSCRFTGRFEKSSLHEVLQVLSSTFHLSFNDKEGVYTLSGKGCH